MCTNQHRRRTGGRGKGEVPLVELLRGEVPLPPRRRYKEKKLAAGILYFRSLFNFKFTSISQPFGSTYGSLEQSARENNLGFGLME